MSHCLLHSKSAAHSLFLNISWNKVQILWNHKKHKLLWLHSFVALLCFEIIVSRMETFEIRLPLKERLVPTLIFRKYVVEESMEISESSKRHESLMPRSLFSFSNHVLKNTNFWDFLALKEAIGYYFQWITCIHFPKIFSWAGYQCFNSMRKTQIALVALFRFCLEIIALKTLIFEVLSNSKRTIGGDIGWNTCTHFHKSCSCSWYKCHKMIWKTYINLFGLFCFCSRIIV